MAGHLARAAPFAYPAPRGQGGLPCPPGYLYVRPRWRQCSAAASHQCASVTLANLKHARTCSCLSSGHRAANPAQALRAKQSQRSSWWRPRASCGWHFAPACCAAQ